MSCGVGRRRCSNLVLLWLWRRPAAAALIRPLAWEPPYAVGEALEKRQKKNKKNNKMKNFGVGDIATWLKNSRGTRWGLFL